MTRTKSISLEERQSYWPRLWRLVSSDYFKLALILGLAFYVAFIPHLDYPYPVHIDEWVHLTYAQALLRAGSTTFMDPFLGQQAATLSSNLEAGYQLFLGVLQAISGLSWLTIARFLPGLVFMSTVLSVYVVAKREGYGWEAAFFTCLIPTTVGILGPAFLVPVAIGLMFILPLPLFLVFNYRTPWSYAVLFLFTSFLLSIHAVSAVGLAILLAPYLVLHLKSDFKHILFVALAVGVPFLAPFPWILRLLAPTAQALFSPHPLETYIEFPQGFREYGYLAVAFCLLGAFVLALKGGRKNYSFVLGLLLLLLVLVAYFTFHYGISILYTRGLLYLMLTMGIIAGAGLHWVGQLKLPASFATRWRLPEAGRPVGRLLSVVLVVLLLALVLPQRLETSYYRMIDDVDYEAFVWIRDNVAATGAKAVLDPWKATAFVAITGKQVYTRIHSFPKEEDKAAREFLEAGCTDSAFLRDNGISLVYSRGPNNNPDLVKVRDFVYLLK